MKRFSDSLIGILDKAYYAYRRNGWILDFRRILNKRAYQKIKIDRPIFLLGTQGGGLTFVSRCLRRHADVVSISGNKHYWSGADEMQHVLGSILPSKLTWKNQTDDPYFGIVGGWVYACDQVISRFRGKRSDADELTRNRFRHVIQWLVFRHHLKQARPRFTDKSQLYTVKLGLLAELLKDCDPKFVLITRNPYALCYRAALGAGLRDLVDNFSYEERLRIAAEHWNNSMRSALEDHKSGVPLHIARFEDVLLRNEESMRAICSYVELEFSEDLLPQEKHTIPFGSLYRDRWYPIRTNVNEKYLDEIDQQSIDTINQICGEVAKSLGYEAPLSNNR